MEFYNFLTSNSGISHAALEPKYSEYKDFPYTLDHVWLMGNKFSVLHDIDDIRAVIQSKLWLSYRSNFPPIGGTGPVSDKNWGCMLRCGQMVMAEALIRRHLGRNWLWNPKAIDPVYFKILSMFQDKKNSPYSIHQIAQMGVSEGKTVGQWFGPNTVAQVLRKLSVYDEWSSLAVHVALDNAVIVDDIKAVCKHMPPPVSSRPLQSLNQNLQYDIPVVRDPNEAFGNAKQHLKWRPLLLFIPLRLGLATLNPVYMRGIKTTFVLKQSLGIIGGKPNHALWFLGYVGNELIYLDPHTTQPYIDLDIDKPDDTSFHIPYGQSRRMAISEMDPSISLCFFIESEEDFENWCRVVRDLLIAREKQPLFELAPDRPEHWPALELEPDLSSSCCSSEYYFVEQEKPTDNSDDEFELFEPILPSGNQGSSSAEGH